MYDGRVNGEIRFIEYYGRRAAQPLVARPRRLARSDARMRLERHYGGIVPIPSGYPRRRPNASRSKYGPTFGIIFSRRTSPFLQHVRRSRLTHDGSRYLCLYATGWHRPACPAAPSAIDRDLKALIAGGWGARADRGAEGAPARSATAAPSCRCRIS
jgi:molybdenum cofactor biosynthesis enzyme MoaA